jgi:hypothetical protein
MAEIVIGEPYSGVPGLALGGYVAGLLGHPHSGAVEVTLRRPVSIGDTLSVDDADGSAQLSRNGEVVASTAPVVLDLEPPARVSSEEAGEASERYLGRHHHFFPTCFCCGPARLAEDGLRIFPGLTASGTAVAAAWTPVGPWAEGHDTVPVPVVWAALDCPAIWAQIAVATPSGEKAVTGRVAVEILKPVAVGSPVVVVGWPLSRTERLLVAGSALLSSDGDILAISRQTMVVTASGVPVDREAWLAAPLA